MRKKGFFVWILGVTALLSYSFQCNRDYEPIPLKYAFKTDVTISPLKRTYTLADTIWMEAVINGKMLYDTISQQLVSADSAALNVNVTCAQLAATNTNPADGLCQVMTPDINNTYRQYSKGNIYANFSNYGCGRSSLKWRFGIKPNYRGTYALFLYAGGSLQTCQNSTTANPFYSIHAYQFATTNLNQGLYTTLPDSARRNDNYSASSITSALAGHSAFIIKVE